MKFSINPDCPKRNISQVFSSDAANIGGGGGGRGGRGEASDNDNDEHHPIRGANRGKMTDTMATSWHRALFVIYFNHP